MNTQTLRSSSRAARQRVQEGQEAPRVDPGPYIAIHMRGRYGSNWHHNLKRARRDESGGKPDAYVRVNVLLNQWKVPFRHDVSIRKARSLVSPAIHTRNGVAHFDYQGHSFQAVVPEPRQRAPGGCSVLRSERHNA